MRLKETHCRSFLRFAVNLDNEIRLNKFACGLICSVYDKSVFNAVEKTRVCARFFGLRRGEGIWLRGQAVKTPPFHGGNTGSSPVGVILKVVCLDL